MRRKNSKNSNKLWPTFCLPTDSSPRQTSISSTIPSDFISWSAGEEDSMYLFLHSGLYQSKIMGRNQFRARWRTRFPTKFLQNLHFPLRKEKLFRGRKCWWRALHGCKWTTKAIKRRWTKSVQKQANWRVYKLDPWHHPQFGGIRAKQKAILPQKKQTKHQQSRNKEDYFGVGQFHESTGYQLFAQHAPLVQRQRSPSFPLWKLLKNLLSSFQLHKFSIPSQRRASSRRYQNNYFDIQKFNHESDQPEIHSRNLYFPVIR